MYGSWDDIDSDSLFSVIAYWQIFTFNKGNANCFAEGYPSGEKTVQSMIIWDVRMPRLLLAVITGAGLAAAGSAYQGIFP